MEQVRAKDVLARLLDQHYEEAWQAKREGRPVGWVSSNFPQEFIECFGLAVVYPENQTAAIAARHESMKLIEQSEELGYCANICGYARVSLAFAEHGQCEAQNMPQPDFLLCSNNICHQLIKWFENIAKEKNIPMILWDAPLNNEYEVTPNRLQYLRDQSDYLIGELEKISGKPFEQAKLDEVMAISNECGRQWNRAATLMESTPSPINGFEMFNHMAVMVCARGRRETAEALKLLADEMQARYDAGETTFRGEPRFRIMTEGISCWPHLRHNAGLLKESGMNMTATVYTETWGRTYDTLDEMLVSYSVVLDNINLERATDRRVRLAQRANCDGILIHLNRSCKAWNGFLFEMERGIKARTGLPTAMYDGDQADPRCYSEMQVETRIQGFRELMESRKEAADGTL